MLNKKQALELFEQEAVFFGEEDGVPLERMLQMFGYEIMKHIHPYLDTHYHYICIDACPVLFITLIGFLVTVTYANAQESGLLKKRWAK